jgi:hypothetical protein
MSSQSSRSLEAESRLPDDLKPVYRRMVKEYAYLTELRYGRGYVAYQVLADLVLAGWRPSAEAHPDSRV